ncbi:MAG TPA: hypothetical protein VH351_15710 [Bryobacteraceae bacterium]|jgi:hypothetical protein|nr:hypothetical protein [Bryobacteraceae bacterium]
MHLKLNRLRACRLPVVGNAKLRIAQLTGACLFDSAELFLPRRWKQLAASAPNALIGSAADLQRLIDRVELGTIDLKTLSHSISVLTAVGDQPLTDAQRDSLWQHFGVPVFELYTDESRILAYECEAHDGWHMAAGSSLRIAAGELLYDSNRREGLRTGLKREIDSQPCPCGRPGARLVHSLNRQATDQPILAAIA